MDLIPRHLAGKVARTLQTSRIINIVGPRQKGKTTLVRDMLQTARFLDLDDEGLLSSLALDAYGQFGDQVLSFGPGRLALPLSLLWSYRTDA